MDITGKDDAVIMEQKKTERINRILTHPSYIEYVSQNAEKEQDRVFCHHDMGHFLDVARLAEILNLTEAYGQDAELIYAAALLHDIGRHIQYETGEDHALVSARMAPAILKDCGFMQEEAEQIVSAIATHRLAEVRDRKDLNGLLYRADKLSRPCYCCKQESACNWKGDKKNRQLI